jgi:microcompartment protein CcmL/EutN
MKPVPAIAVVELADIPIGMRATDALAKKAPIAFLKCGTITRGRYLVFFGGSTAAVDEALGECLYWGGRSVIDHVFLADVHPELFDAMMGARRPAASGSLAVLETTAVSAIVRAAEAALKGTPVELVEIRLADAGLGGKGVAILRGELHDVEAAVQIATSAVQARGGTLQSTIISAPHEAVYQQVSADTHFASAPLLELDGETD